MLNSIPSYKLSLAHVYLCWAWLICIEHRYMKDEIRALKDAIHGLFATCPLSICVGTYVISTQIRELKEKKKT